MWRQNLLFAGLAVLGLGSLAGSLLPSRRIEEPQTFSPNRMQQEDFASVVQQVNAEFRADWKLKKLEHAGRADHLTVARRLSLGLMGTIPSLEEINELEKQKPEHRLEWWLSRVLEDKRYRDYVAERLARAYVGVENGPFLVYRRRRFTFWLSEQLKRNKENKTPYDKLVRRLLTDEGLWTDKPAVNFVTVTIDDGEGKRPDPITLAHRTTRAFLGMRIDCLQCHDDNLGTMNLGSPGNPVGGTQMDFHQLAAYFAHTSSSLSGIVENGEDSYKYVFLGDEDETAVEPQPPFLPDIVPSEGSYREKLAAWITHPENKPFARAMVNRVWALLFGQPLVNPIDDIPLHGEFMPEGKYPPALETLSQDFVENGFDLRRLIRVIAATEVFQLDSQANSFEVMPKHEEAWAVFPLTRLRPDQMSGSLIQSTSLTTIDANSHIFSRLRRFAEQNNFVQRYGDTGEDEFEDHGGTIPQRLLMMNGELVGNRARGNNPLLNAVSQISVMSPTDEKAVQMAYLAILSRQPTPDETLAFANELKGKRGDERNALLEDIYWILLNSTEFSWNH